MSKRIKIYRGIAVALGLIGLTAVIISIFTDNSKHNFPLVIGLCLTAISNTMNAFISRADSKNDNGAA